ncbi:MAG: aminopeptidase [Candidatus Margulisiibacteriota bacterium]
MSGLIKGAQIALKERYNLRAGQKVLVFHDLPKKKIGAAFVEAARNLGAEVKVFQIGKERFAGDTQERLAAALSGHSFALIINVLKSLVEETPDRVNLGKMETGPDTVIAHCPEIEEAMLKIKINFGEMIDNARKLLENLKAASEVHIKTALGTDVKIDIRGREFHDDIIPRTSGITNFPCGELFCAPVESGTNGTVIADASTTSLGILPQPLKLEINGGRLTSLQWLNAPARNNRLLAKLRASLSQDDEAGLTGELGIGLASYPICGNMLQDEKVAGTIHIAFGFNRNFGGRNNSKSHFDFLVRDPELTVYYPDRPPQTIMRAGKLLI